VDEEDTSEHSHSSQKEIHDAKHFASPRDLEAVHSSLTLDDWCGKQTPASSGPVMTSVCFADENLKSPDIFGRDQARSLDISPQETDPHSPTIGAASSQQGAQFFQAAIAGKGKERASDQSSSTRSAQRSLPFSDSLALGVLGSKRTRETQRVFQPRVDLLPPPKPGLTYKYRVEIIMADGAEAGPHSVLQSREDKSLIGSACEHILRQYSVLDESVEPSIQYAFQPQVLRTRNLLCDQTVLYTCKDAIRRYTIHMNDLSAVFTICIYNN